MEKIRTNDLYDYSFLSELNHCKNTTALVVSRAVEKTNSYHKDLYIQKDKEYEKVMDYDGCSNLLFESENEICFTGIISSRDKNRRKAGDCFTPLYQLNLKTGKRRKLAEIPLSVNSMAKIEKDCYLIQASVNKNYPDYYKASVNEKQRIIDEIEKKEAYEWIDENQFYFNGAGYVNDFYTSLFIYDRKTNTVFPVSPEKFRVSGSCVIGHKIYYFGSQEESKLSLKSVLYVYDLDKKENRILNDDRYYAIYTLINWDDRLFMTCSDNLDYGMNKNFYLAEINTESGKVSLFVTKDMSYENTTSSDVRLGKRRAMKVFNHKLYFVETRRNSGVLTSFDLNGTQRDIYGVEGSVDDFDIDETGIYMTVNRADKLPEVYRYQEKDIKQLSFFNTEALKNKYVALPHKETIVSCGREIDGWVYYPYDFDSSKKYPAILDIHGGPKTAYGELFTHEMQVWASAGYFVFCCNPIGSDGRGNEFADIRSRYGTLDYQNIMDFTDHVLSAYKNINSEQVFVTGGSYGGFMTNWIVGHTDRFKAAATQRSISNWISFEGVSDIGIEFGRDQNGGSFKNRILKLWDHSPLKYADRVKTPILILHSDQDYRCPLEQGLQFYNAVKEVQKDTSMIIFHKENHELSRSGKPKNRITRLNKITEWFDMHQ